jgi:hypothetical protein
LGLTAGDLTVENAYGIKGKLVAGTAVYMMTRNSSDQVAIDADGYGTVIGFSGYRLQVAGGNATLQNGNFVPSTAAKGINFTANTGAAGMTSQLLNWYEEGTWTPSVTSNTGTITTVGTCTGQYTRIGRQVTLSMDLRITTNGTGAGYLKVTGVPFNMGTTLYGAGVGSEIGVTGKMLQISPATATQINITNYDGTYPGADGFRASCVWTYFV